MSEQITDFIDLINANTARKMVCPEEGTDEYFQRHKLLANQYIKLAIINKNYECCIIDFDLWLDSETKNSKIFRYLEEKGFDVSKYKGEQGLGILISWGYRYE